MKAALLAAARQALLAAYAPYSHYRVGAALLCADGRIVSGCNVENASYGLTLCAERTALCAAVAQGQRDFRALAIIGSGTAPAWPCGACLQVLAEFAPDLPLYIGSDEAPELIETTVRALLPAQFALKKEEDPR